MLEKRWMLLLLAAALVVRLAAIDRLPPGLNQKKAYIGYDAYALPNFGIDRNGIQLLVHLIS